MEDDEFDTGKRNLLNYGHTLGHALESVSNYRIPHGQAVIIGMSVVAMFAICGAGAYFHSIGVQGAISHYLLSGVLATAMSLETILLLFVPLFLYIVMYLHMSRENSIYRSIFIVATFYSQEITLYYVWSGMIAHFNIFFLRYWFPAIFYFAFLFLEKKQKTVVSRSTFVSAVVLIVIVSIAPAKKFVNDYLSYNKVFKSHARLTVEPTTVLADCDTGASLRFPAKRTDGDGRLAVMAALDAPADGAITLRCAPLGQPPDAAPATTIALRKGLNLIHLPVIDKPFQWMEVRLELPAGAWRFQPIPTDFSKDRVPLGADIAFTAANPLTVAMAHYIFDNFNLSHLLKVGVLPEPNEENYGTLYSKTSAFTTIKFRKTLPALVTYLRSCEQENEA